jgi:hypothetical protein
MFAPSEEESMGAMKEFLMWCEEKGYYEWSDLTDQYEWVGPEGKTPTEAMSEWMEEPNVSE